MSGGLPEPSPFDRREAFEMGAQQLRIDLAEYEANMQRSMESARAGNTSGSEAIKAATLVNGGAAVAVLAFIGHLASINAIAATKDLAWSLFIFVAGTWLGVLASGMTYLFHCAFVVSLEHEFESGQARRDGDQVRADSEHVVSDTLRRRAKRINAVTVLLVAVSLILFVLGCVSAYRVFRSGVMMPPKGDQPTVSRFFADIL